MSDKAKYTPGPWTNDPLQDTIWADDGQTKVATIADLPWVNGKSDWLTEQANARLISLAPEMAEALKAFATLVVETCPRCEGSGGNPSAPADACVYCGGTGKDVRTPMPDDIACARAILAKLNQ